MRDGVLAVRPGWLSPSRAHPADALTRPRVARRTIGHVGVRAHPRRRVAGVNGTGVSVVAVRHRRTVEVEGVGIGRGQVTNVAHALGLGHVGELDALRAVAIAIEEPHPDRHVRHVAAADAVDEDARYARDVDEVAGRPVLVAEEDDAVRRDVAELRVQHAGTVADVEDTTLDVGDRGFAYAR